MYVDRQSCLAFADSVILALMNSNRREELVALLESIARELGFRYYALIHHDDLRQARADRVDLKEYPNAVSERLIGH